MQIISVYRENYSKLVASEESLLRLLLLLSLLFWELATRTIIYWVQSVGFSGSRCFLESCYFGQRVSFLETSC